MAFLLPVSLFKQKQMHPAGIKYATNKKKRCRKREALGCKAQRHPHKLKHKRAVKQSMSVTRGSSRWSRRFVPLAISTTGWDWSSFSSSLESWGLSIKQSLEQFTHHATKGSPGLVEKVKLLLKSKSKSEMRVLASQLSCSETLVVFQSALLRAKSWRVNSHEHWDKVH